MTTLTTPSRLDARMLTSRLIGILFLAGFLLYGTGNALVTSVADGQDLLASVPAHATLLALGAFLMLTNTAADIGKAVLFFPVVDQYGRKTALTYLAAMILQVVLMATGALAVLMLVPLARESAEAGPEAGGWATPLANLALDANELGYQAGQLALSVGAFVLVVLLYRTRLVPRWLAGLGLAGYVLHAAGSAAELFGVHISLVLLIPGALFEIGLAVWLLVRGFDPEAYEGPRSRAAA
ncbi:DUF4386 domain-containing protein [Myceligenerans pegani]|uniref:DUF4386 domain-containing protein n=1 Tax=Myceligenerans pegani TaxID=2776917 RepID=A0ABR9MW83_9MICO|nr:DUF4386 domain-containing protein [Myceligenerans sp. TRM 65318]MBE1875643.1 DUF4386 domain-containing protein [Myceligenerans sp. TRM 65318]MBE3017914.1 DUF4386 domain-containing protein [Myceligenerans sp. TRM 65318]